ncbi:alpha/beta hydrolase [Schlesneria sp. T3-172]|uniref:alpha/beta hydrolase n=1 Tax=Schlesneria sphaerica TaxID=3373610 RepID=UPI0037CA1A45
MFWLSILVASVVAVDVIVQCIYVRLVLRIFETKPPFSVPPVPRDPAAEEVSFQTRDGITLRGSIHFNGQSVPRGVILFCPELEGSHWSASIYARGLLEAGFKVVAFDFRNQGESESLQGYSPLHWATEFEVEDALSALRFIASRPDLNHLPLGVMGVSRGSTPALIAAARSERVKAVFCEGAYSTDALLVHFISRWATLYVPRVFLPLLPMWHIRLTSVLVRWTSQLLRKRPYVVLENWLQLLRNRSVLLVAGERDNYVHPDVGRHLYRRLDSPRAKLWLVPAAKHNRARHVAPIEYDRRISDFFDSSLDPRETLSNQRPHLKVTGAAIGGDLLLK